MGSAVRGDLSRRLATSDSRVSNSQGTAGEGMPEVLFVAGSAVRRAMSDFRARYHEVENDLGHPRSAVPRHPVVRDAMPDFRVRYYAVARATAVFNARFSIEKGTATTRDPREE
jgi:hypothetical protein